MSNNSTQKKDRKFFFRRKGEMQGTSAPTALLFARFTNSVVAHVPNPPDYTDFYFLQLVGVPTAYLAIETETSDDIVEITSPEVSHILEQIEANTPCSASFSNRLITISGPAGGGWVKIKPYDTDKTLDAARLLGFSYGEFFPAYSKEGWDAPAPGKNKETFVQRYENNISDAVNRGLSALASNIEEHHRFLSEELVVPRFINTVENPGVLDTWEDADNVLGLILSDRAYVSDIKVHSPASIERFFVLTDKFGACSITVGDREEPVRICDVTTNEPAAGTVPRRQPYFTDLGATTEYVSAGDGNSIIGLPQQTSQGVIGEFSVSHILDNSKIRVAESTAEIYPGCRVLWPGDDLNSGEYTVVSVDSDVIELLATDSGRDSLMAEPPAGGSVVILHSTVISTDVTSDPLYLLFDTPISKTSTAALHGFGLLYGARTTVKDFLTTTLMGNLKGQAVSDIVVRSLQAIRGPNSRNYRSTRVGDPDGYDGEIDTSADGGDLISLETLANRSLLGRDVFDLSGGITESDSPSHYTITDGSRANAFAGNPLTLYGETAPVANEFSLIASAIDVDSNKWTSRLGGSGPFNGKLNNGGILQAGDKFLPTDVGLTVKLSEVGGVVPDDNQKQLLRVWTISKYISPDRVLLTCPDLPSHLPYAVDDLFVQFKFGAREARNLSAGALLRLDKTTSDDSQFDGAKVNALVLADTAGITGVVTLTPIEHVAGAPEEKREFRTSSDNSLELDLSFTNNSNFIYQLHPQDKTTPLVPSVVQTSELVGLDAGSWTTVESGPLTLVTFKHTPVMGATVVEVISVDGTFDALLLVKRVKLSLLGDYIFELCDFALNDVPVPTGTTGRCRLFNLNTAQALRSVNKKWDGPAVDSLAYHSFFGTGKTFGGNFSEETATVARFGGSGSLDSVVEVRASGEKPFLALGDGGGAKVYVPKTALSIWASSPSQGIEVNTATSEDPGLRDVFGGTGVRIASFTGFRAHREDLGSSVYPGSAAVIATQFYDADHEVRNDPVKRDPVAIFATQLKPAAVAETDLSIIPAVVPVEYDTNSQVISYVHGDVYQRSDDRAKWSVFIYQDPTDAENSEYLQIYSDTPGYLDYTVVVTSDVTATEQLVIDPVLKELRINPPCEAAGLATAINASPEAFSAIVSDAGIWTITAINMPGSGSASISESSFTPSSIIQSNINTAIEAIQGDIVVTDGIFSIEGDTRLTGVGSHLIPVNPEVPLQPTSFDAEAIDPATGYDLGEQEILYSVYQAFSTGISTFIPAAGFPVDEKHINRKVTFTNFAPETDPEDETITRYITGINGAAYTLNMPIVFNNWAGTSASQSGVITIYGRRWRNIYAQNLESSTVAVDELVVTTADIEAANIETANIGDAVIGNLEAESIVANVIPKDSLIKTIPARDFGIYTDPDNALSFKFKFPYEPDYAAAPLLDPPFATNYVGWYLDRPLEPITVIPVDNTARLVYCWSPQISAVEPENGIVRYRITDVVAHFTSKFALPALSREFSMLNIRRHEFEDENAFIEDINPGFYAGGYSVDIPAEFAGSVPIPNRVVAASDADYNTPTLTMRSPTVVGGFFSFEILMRPQILFCGLTIRYKKVFP